MSNNLPSNAFDDIVLSNYIFGEKIKSPQLVPSTENISLLLFGEPSSENQSTEAPSSASVDYMSEPYELPFNKVEKRKISQTDSFNKSDNPKPTTAPPNTPTNVIYANSPIQKNSMHSSPTNAPPNTPTNAFFNSDSPNEFQPFQKEEKSIVDSSGTLEFSTKSPDESE